MADDEIRWSRLKRKIVTAWLLIAIAPSVPLVIVLVVSKAWQLAWPIILVALGALVWVGARRLIAERGWRWR